MSISKNCAIGILTLILGGAAPAFACNCSCCKSAAPISGGAAVVPTGGKSMQVTLSVSGMSCATCAAKVQKALLGVPGVRQAHVDVAAGKAIVTADEAKCDEQAMVKAIERAGYGAK